MTLTWTTWTTLIPLLRIPRLQCHFRWKRVAVPVATLPYYFPTRSPCTDRLRQQTTSFTLRTKDSQFRITLPFNLGTPVYLRSHYWTPCCRCCLATLDNTPSRPKLTREQQQWTSSLAWNVWKPCTITENVQGASSYVICINKSLCLEVDEVLL